MGMFSPNSGTRRSDRSRSPTRIATLSPNALSTNIGSRRPRFQRRDVKANIVITDRDLAIFSALILDRFLTADDLARLIMPDADICDPCSGQGAVFDAAVGRDVHHTLCLGTGRRGDVSCHASAPNVMFSGACWRHRRRLSVRCN